MLMSEFRTLSLAALFVFAAAGCTVGPDYRRPTEPVGSEAPLVSTDPQALDASTEPPPEWWRLYNDPTLDRFLEEAFRANYDLKSAEANLSAARALQDASQAGLYPTTDARVGGIRGRNATTDQILEITGHQPKTTWSFNAIFDVAYEVDLFGRVRRSIEASKADTAAAAAARDAVKITVAAETARAYGQVCAFGQQIAVTQHSIEVVQREADITHRRMQAGAGSEFEYVRASGLVAQVQATLPPLEGQRRSALYQLAALLGRTPTQAPVEVLSCEAPPQLQSLLPVGDGASLLRRRPDVRQADQIAAGATARIGVATADLYPRVSLLGFAGGVGAHLSDITAEQGLTWGIGPSITWTFPNMAVPRARIRQADARADAAVANFDQTVLQALKETEQSLTTYSADLKQRASLNDAQALAHRTFQLAKGQLSEGSISSLDLLTSEQTLVASDAAIAASNAKILQDQIQVFKALGGGW